MEISNISASPQKPPIPKTSIKSTCFLALVLFASCVLILIALIVGSLFLSLWYFPDPAESQEHKELLNLYSLIEIGMSKEEVKQHLPATSNGLYVFETEREIHVTTPTDFFRNNRTMGIYFGDSGMVVVVRIRTTDSGVHQLLEDPPDKIDKSVTKETLNKIDEDEYSDRDTSVRLKG